MKTSIATVLFVIFAFTGTAEADHHKYSYVCTPSNVSDIVKGLIDMYNNSYLTEEERKEALFAASLIANDQSPVCSFDDTFKPYHAREFSVQTSTHIMKMTGDSKYGAYPIHSLKIERIVFN